MTSESTERLSLTLPRVSRSGCTIPRSHRVPPSLWPAQGDGSWSCVPSYVSDPRVTPEGIEVYVDGGGAMDAPMAATLRRGLREELEGTVRTVGVVAVR